MPGWTPARTPSLSTFRPNFQQDVLAGRSPAIQLNTDATRVGQAFTGSGYVQTIVIERSADVGCNAIGACFTTAGRHRGAGALQPEPEPVAGSAPSWR